MTALDNLYYSDGICLPLSLYTPGQICIRSMMSKYQDDKLAILLDWRQTRSLRAMKEWIRKEKALFYSVSFKAKNPLVVLKLPPSACV
jgi:hypothetical protein